jgi:hypothetical protein
MEVTGSSLSFDDHAQAVKFRDLIDRYGVGRALATVGVDQAPQSTLGLTVEQFLLRHIEHLTGIDRKTVDQYRAYVRNDIAETLGVLPLAALTREDVARWLTPM